MSEVLVTGGSGLLGRAVVTRLAAAGHSVRVLTRSGSAAPHAVPGDLHTGAGLDTAVAGVTAIVHCASDPRDPQRVDVAGTRRLVEAARRAGRPHVVDVSIVGVDRIPWAYYRAELAAERAIQGSGMPWTVLRTTQFHEFSLDLLRRAARLPVVPMPRGWRVQSIDIDEVARRLAGAVARGPAGLPTWAARTWCRSRRPPRIPGCRAPSPAGRRGSRARRVLPIVPRRSEPGAGQPPGRTNLAAVPRRPSGVRSPARVSAMIARRHR